MVNSSFILLNSPLIPLPTPTRAPKAPAISLPTATHSDSLSSPTFSARSAGSAVAPFFTDLIFTGSAKEHSFLFLWQHWHDRALELEDLNNKSVRRIRDDYTTTHLIGQKQSASALRHRKQSSLLSKPSGAGSALSDSSASAAAAAFSAALCACRAAFHAAFSCFCSSSSSSRRRLVASSWMARSCSRVGMTDMVYTGVPQGSFHLGRWAFGDKTTRHVTEKNLSIRT